MTNSLIALVAMLSNAAPSLAYRPFLDPIDVHGWWWWLVLPLVVGISMGYKAMRLPTLERYWRQVAKMSAQIMVVLIAISIVLLLIVQWAAPRFF